MPELTAETPPGDPTEAASGVDLALDAAAGLLRGGRAIGIGSPRSSLEDNHALRALVGPGRFYRGMSDADDRLVGAVLDVAADERLRLGSLADVSSADVVLVLGEDLTNTAPMLDLTIRTWLHLRPCEVEERNHIRRWNDAGITRIKRREPSALWLATTHATKLDAVAAEVHRATPDDLVRLALAIAHEADSETPAVPGLSDAELALARRWAAAFAAAAAPLVVAGCSSGSPDLIRAAAHLTLALRRGEDPAALVLTVPEPDSVGLRMLGGGTLVQGLAALARGEADAVVVLDNDLGRRAPALLIDDFLRRRVPTIALATLEDRLTAQADVVLPTATWAESTGTFVSHEGRAQRFFSVLPPAGEARPAWRWARDLMQRLGRREAHGWRTQDDVLADLEAELPAFRGVTSGAAAGRLARRRTQGRPPAAALQRAHGSSRRPHRPRAGADSRSGLGARLLARGPAAAESPAALRARVWSPGWNSVNGLHKFEQELEAVRPAESLGVRAPGRAGARRELASAGAAAAIRDRGRRVHARRPAPHLRLRGPQHVRAGDRGARARRLHRPERGGRRPPGRPRGRLAGALAAVDGRARALRAGAVARDGHGRGPRRPPRPAVHLPAGTRPAVARGGAGMTWYWQLLTVLLVLIAVLTVAAGLIWYERRLLSLVQDRYGPNRVGPFGLFQVLADTFKLLFKEDWVPPFSDKRVFVVRVPGAGDGAALLHRRAGRRRIVVADLDVGLLFFLAMSSLAVYSVVLAGWSSHSKYSLVGGLRAAAQMVSYEVFMGLSLVGVVTMAGSFGLRDIVEAQKDLWFVVPQFVGFAVFLVAGFAETRRIPFDLVEAESELVAGYHTEYSGMKFGLFMVGEYVAVTLISR